VPAPAIAIVEVATGPPLSGIATGVALLPVPGAPAVPLGGRGIDEPAPRPSTS
jgi:hypothetical protein